MLASINKQKKNLAWGKETQRKITNEHLSFSVSLWDKYQLKLLLKTGNKISAACELVKLVIIFPWETWMQKEHYKSQN